MPKDDEEKNVHWSVLHLDESFPGIILLYHKQVILKTFGILILQILQINFNTFHYIISKSHIYNITTNKYHQKSLKYQKTANLTVVYTILQILIFNLKGQILSGSLYFQESL